mmetsp:Transcript_8238/g.16245  ORF Transcript_8238/g.16245 Transcript_8238/m.16245 type:complete len:220 (-) Transcript_8238:1190-1849(-)
MSELSPELESRESFDGVDRYFAMTFWSIEEMWALASSSNWVSRTFDEEFSTFCEDLWLSRSDFWVAINLVLDFLFKSILASGFGRGISISKSFLPEPDDLLDFEELLLDLSLPTLLDKCRDAILLSEELLPLSIPMNESFSDELLLDLSLTTLLDKCRDGILLSEELLPLSIPMNESFSDELLSFGFFDGRTSLQLSPSLLGDFLAGLAKGFFSSSDDD